MSYVNISNETVQSMVNILRDEARICTEIMDNPLSIYDVRDLTPRSLETIANILENAFNLKVPHENAD